MFPCAIRSLTILAAACAIFGANAAAQTIVPESRLPSPIPVPPIMPPDPRRPTPMPRIEPHPIRPRPPQRNRPLDVRKHLVEVNITDGVAVTRIDQVFINPQDWPVEGTYIFPLEDDVSVSQFSMDVNGQKVEGKVLSVEEARRTYESIVAATRDPALLEYLGRRLFQARIFPIPPKGEARINLSYSQLLRAEDGLVKYRYPLCGGSSLSRPVELVGVTVRVDSSTPIKSFFSPSHPMAFHRTSDFKASASFEERNMYPDRPLELYYTLSDKEFGLTLLTHRDPGEDGFFLLRIAPPAVAGAADVLPKDITFVIDTSGSMSGEKIKQAREALKFCVSSLNKEDRFNIIPFSHEALRFRDSPVTASAENVEQARAFADGLTANGGTNVHDALLLALSSAPTDDSARPYLIVFLTDGQPTVSVTNPNDILKAVREKNLHRVRLFVFGVGHDVNTYLLDSLAEQNRGARDYVEPNEDIEIKLSTFYRKVADPVLADLSISFSSIQVTDMYPPKLADLFSGGELVAAGRYRGEGPAAVELVGTRRGRSERFIYEKSFPALERGHDFLPTLWATRKVGYLLDEIRLHGENPELKDTVIQLATKYGIVTPYTAYLVTEPGGLARRPGEPINPMAQAVGRSEDFDDVEKSLRVIAPPGSASGIRDSSPPMRERQIRASREIDDLRQAQSAIAPPSMRTIPGSWSGTDPHPGSMEVLKKRAVVQRVGLRTFYFIDDKWVDAAYDGKAETTKIVAFSPEYFELLKKHDQLGRCFSLGERVIVVLDGKAYETIPPPE